MMNKREKAREKANDKIIAGLTETVQKLRKELEEAKGTGDVGELTTPDDAREAIGRQVADGYTSGRLDDERRCTAWRIVYNTWEEG